MIRSLLLVSICILAILFISLVNKKNYNDISGTYVSKAPNREEKISIMYSRGYFNFLYTSEGDEILQLDKDSTFTYTRTLCKVGERIFKGKWHVTEDRVSLHYENEGRKDKSFNFEKAQLYNISDAVTEGKKMKMLTLFKKK